MKVAAAVYEWKNNIKHKFVICKLMNEMNGTEKMEQKIKYPI